MWDSNRMLTWVATLSRANLPFLETVNDMMGWSSCTLKWHNIDHHPQAQEILLQCLKNKHNRDHSVRMMSKQFKQYHPLSNSLNSSNTPKSCFPGGVSMPLNWAHAFFVSSGNIWQKSFNILKKYKDTVVNQRWQLCRLCRVENAL